MLNEVFLYTLFRAAFLGLLTQPIPLLPYAGITAFFIALFARPVVRALRLRFRLGFLIPIFIPDASSYQCGEV